MVRVEDHNVSSAPRQWAKVRAHALALRRLGVPQTAVHAGQPAFIKTSSALDTWARHNSELRPWINSPLLNFALWTITKEEINDPHT